MTIWVAIDPGVSGAIAAIGHGGARVADIPTLEIPGTGRTKRVVHGYALAVLLRQMVPAEEAAIVVLEDVHAMPSNVSGSGANTSLMHSKGVIEGVLSVLRMEVRSVNTRKWKGMFGLGADKAHALEIARKLYPALADSHLKRAKDHNRADAILMAHFGKAKLS
jgi:crossover junction endodeoxyribonuclease RuvC